MKVGIRVKGKMMTSTNNK